ncbi:hypothetical protein KXR83_16095 [Williamsia muralis]|uniref:hypothetical protein n=1 Tax=Williamsia marianensis TaxID=85044 RepID=UPI003F150589
MTTEDNDEQEKLGDSDPAADHSTGDVETGPGEDASADGASVESEISTPYRFEPGDVELVASILDRALGDHLLHGWEGWTATEDAIEAEAAAPSESLKRAMISITC